MTNVHPLNKILSLHSAGTVSAALVISAKIKLYEVLKDKPKTLQELAEATNTKKEILEKILLILDSHDIVNKISDDTYQSTEMTYWIIGVDCPIFNEGNIALASGLYNSLKTNEIAFENVYGKTFYKYLLDNPDKLEEFNSWCHLTAKKWLDQVFLMYDFSWVKNLVDVGGGKGYFVSEFLRKNSLPC
jgi:hypothetical protein